jgi:hypothetical protein
MRGCNKTSNSTAPSSQLIDVADCLCGPGKGAKVSLPLFRVGFAVLAALNGAGLLSKMATDVGP